MSRVEETYNGGLAYKRVQRQQTRNGKVSSSLENGGSSSETCELFRTYKRRKNMLNFRSGGFFERESLASKEEETHCSHVPSVNHLQSDCSQESRTFVLQKMYESLKADDGGIKGCIKEALLMAESDSPEVLGSEPQSFRSTEILKRAFLRILLSEKFTLFCKFLFNNFDTLKFETFLSLPIIDKKMRDGTYEQSPLLFSSDIQPLWLEFQRIGSNLVSVSTGLLDFSKMILDRALHRNGFLAEDCLVSSIEPVKKPIPSSGRWATDSSPEIHKNCVVCEKLTVETGDRASSINEDYSSNSEETSSNTWPCKICQMDMGGDSNVKICEHRSCPFKRFHARCLTKEQVKSYGPRWYCPSCLCRACLTDMDDHKIVLCDCCDDAYHVYCLAPPLAAIPPGKWLCRHCRLKLRILRKAKRI